MAAADNPYYIKPVNAMEALMSGYQGYDTAQKAGKERQMQEGRQAAMTALQGGGDLKNPLAALIGIGDVEGAKAISTFAEHQANRQFRETEADRAQTNADRQYALSERQFNEGKHPPGFQSTPTGLAPTPGGPADPAYIQQQTAAKEKPREFNVGDITKLQEEGGKFNSLSNFKDTFDPRFAGYRTQGLGNVAVAAGRYVPELVSKDTQDSANWWQSYAKYKNVVRHELYGSALTKPEQNAFDQADINPGMHPDVIKKNLENQHLVAMNGLKRKANALIAAGYDPRAISAAYGLDLKDIGVKDQGRARGPAAPAATAPSAPVAPQAPVDWTQYFGAGR